MISLIGALLLLFPANILFLLILFRWTDGFSSTKASAGVFYFAIFNVIYILGVLEYNLLKLPFDPSLKLFIISSLVIITAIIYRRKITSWLIKVFKLAD